LNSIHNIRIPKRIDNSDQNPGRNTTNNVIGELGSPYGVANNQIDAYSEMYGNRMMSLPIDNRRSGVGAEDLSLQEDIYDLYNQE